MVPGAPALLTAYAGRLDPLSDVRAAAVEAVRWLVDGADEVRVWCAPLSDPDRDRGVTVAQGERIARDLLGAAAFGGRVSLVEPGCVDAVPVLVVANGSARRSEKAPGHLDERSHDFDAAVEKALADGDAKTLAGIDLALGAELLATGLHGLRALGQQQPVRTSLDLADDPFGVRYWVARWSWS